MPRGDGMGPGGGGGGYSRGRGKGRGHKCSGGVGRGRRVQKRVQEHADGGAAVQGQPAVGSPLSTPREHGILTEAAVAAEQTHVEHAPGVAVVDGAACTPCGACQSACPTEAITLGEVTASVNTEACCGCGACVDVCPSGAIALS